MFSTRLENFLAFSSNSKLLTPNSFQFGRVWNLSFWKGLNSVFKSSPFRLLQNLELCCLTHYQMTNFRLFQLKDFADDNLKCEENGRKLFKPVEKHCEKRKIARYEQFFFFHSVFKQLVSQGRQKVSLCGNGLKLMLYHKWLCNSFFAWKSVFFKHWEIYYFSTLEFLNFSFHLE